MDKTILKSLHAELEAQLTKLMAVTNDPALEKAIHVSDRIHLYLEGDYERLWLMERDLRTKAETAATAAEKRCQEFVDRQSAATSLWTRACAASCEEPPLLAACRRLNADYRPATAPSASSRSAALRALLAAGAPARDAHGCCLNPEEEEETPLAAALRAMRALNSKPVADPPSPIRHEESVGEKDEGTEEDTDGGDQDLYS